MAALLDLNPLVAEKAGASLGELGDGRCVPALIRVLLGADEDAERWVRKAATDLGHERLCRERWPAAYEKDWLTRSWTNGPRAGAARGLACLEDRRAFGPLVHVLFEDAPAASATAAIALGHLGDARACDPLIIALGSADDNVREYAAVGLAFLGDDRGLGALGKAADAEKEFDVRLAMLAAMSSLGRSEALDGVIAALGSEDKDTGWDACNVLYELPDNRATDALLRLLTDGDIDIRIAAGGALSRLGGREVVDRIARSLDDPRTAETAARVLTLIGDEPALEVLRRALREHPRTKVRAVAARGLRAAELRALREKRERGETPQSGGRDE